MYRVNRISSLSFGEIIELRSTLHALSNQKFICSTCQGQFANRRDTEEMLEKEKRLKGCTQISVNRLHTIVQSGTKITYNTCIGNFVSDSCIQWIQFYNHFEKGTMPFTGGYMDQPSKVIDIMNVIANHKHEQMQKDAQNRQHKNRNNVREIKRGRK